MDGSVQSATGPIVDKKSIDMNKLDRRVAVAPMMDWIDEEEIACRISRLVADRGACRLYVSSENPTRPGG